MITLFLKLYIFLGRPYGMLRSRKIIKMDLIRVRFNLNRDVYKIETIFLEVNSWFLTKNIFILVW